MALINEHIVKEQILNAVTECIGMYLNCYEQLQSDQIPYVLSELNDKLDKILNDEK